LLDFTGFTRLLEALRRLAERSTGGGLVVVLGAGANQATQLDSCRLG
jgi:hypothetical protein